MIYEFKAKRALMDSARSFHTT